MKTSSIALLFFAALGQAQVTSFPNGTFLCALPGGAYCAGASLATNIIIRCSAGHGFPGNCNDNLDSVPPQGFPSALCYQSSATAGDAACEKSGVVYGQNGSFPLPNATVTTTSSTGTTVILATGTGSSTGSSNGSTTVTTPTPSATVFLGGASSLSLGSGVAFLVMGAAMAFAL